MYLYFYTISCTLTIRNTVEINENTAPGLIWVFCMGLFLLQKWNNISVHSDKRPMKITPSLDNKSRHVDFTHKQTHVKQILKYQHSKPEHPYLMESIYLSKETYTLRTRLNGTTLLKRLQNTFVLSWSRFIAKFLKQVLRIAAIVWYIIFYRSINKHTSSSYKQHCNTCAVKSQSTIGAAG